MEKYENAKTTTLTVLLT